MQALRRFFRRNDLFFTYMLPVFLAFLAVLVYLMINANYQIRNAVEEDVQSVTITGVESLRTRMDTVLEDVENSLTQLGSSADTLTLLKNLEDGNESVESLERVMSRLKEEQNFTLGVENYGIYHGKSRSVVLPDGRIDSSEYLSDVIASDDPRLFLKQLNEVDDLALWVIRNRNGGIESIMASQSYPASRHTKTASGFATLSISTLRQILRENVRSSTNYLILDSEGEILLAAGTEGIPTELLRNMVQSGKTSEQIRNRGLFLYSLPSNSADWHYAGVVSMAEYRSLTVLSNARSIIVVIVGFLAGIAASFLLSRRVTRQLDAMSETLSRAEGGRVEEDQTILLFYSMNQRLEQALDRNDRLSETVQNNRDMILEIFYRDIILQRAKPEDYTAHFARLGIEWPKGSVFLILIRVRGDTDDSPAHYRDLCRQWQGRLELERGEEAIFFSLQDEWIACVVTVQWADRLSQVTGRVRYYLNSILRNTPHGSYPMAVSDGYPNLSYLPYAYQECMNLMAAQFYGRTVSGGFMESVDYPYEKERLLLNCLMGGDEAHMLERLEEFFELNFSVHPLNLSAIDRFSHLLTGTMRRAIAESELAEDVYSERFMRMYQRAEEADSQKAFCELFRTEFLWLCRTIADSRNSRTDLMAQRIRDYIAEHYREDFSMADLARELNLSMSYMSVVFKRSMGRNFSDYLNRYRIGVAKDLLIHSDRTVSQIAADTGFISANTFIRTFKKVEGITPGQYRGAGLSDDPEERI